MKLIKDILAFINKHQKFLITAHARPDGDALGSELALALFLKKMGKNVRIVHQNDIPPEYNFLPGRKMVEEISGPVMDSNLDAIFILDSDGLDRLEKLAGYIPLNLPTVNIDHHPSNNHFGVINWADGSMSSVGEMVYRLIKASEAPIDKNIAVNLYVSLITDTGNFCYASTTPFSHIMASDLLRHKINLTQIFQKIYKNLTLKDLALRCDCTRRIRIVAGGQIAYTELTRSMFRKYRVEPRDTQQYFDLIRSIKGVKISLLFRESMNKGEGIKVGIRTEPPINASKLALVYGGGGHYRAAGCTVYKPLRETQKIVVAEAEKFIKGQ